jgi:Family of unknown function (DUF6812)
VSTTESSAHGPSEAPGPGGAQEPPRSIDHRRERICLETSRHRIEGYVTLARDGFRSRVSDMLNASERDFLTLTDATVELLDGSRRERHHFLAVARRHIVFAVIADAHQA